MLIFVLNPWSFSSLTSEMWQELLYSLPSGKNLLWVPKEKVPTSYIYGLFLPQVSTIYVIMLNIIEREQRMPLRRGEEKRSENREKERERQCRTEQEKEKEIKTETERKIEKKKKWEVKHCPISKHNANM